MNLRDTYEALSADTLNQFIEEQRGEDLHLEFKTVAKASLTDKSDKKNLAKALSGFANSDGGLIIWGVDARPADQGTDRAQELVPIAPLSQFLSKLNDLTGQYVAPVVDGVQHRAIPVPGEPDKGFAITLDPASDSTPHRAEAGVGRYYKRSGSSFYPMEHFDLEDMFGRRRRPRLVLDYALNMGGRLSGSRGWTVTVSIDLYLENKGRAIAQFPFIELAFSDATWMSSVWRSKGWLGPARPRTRNDRSRVRFLGGSESVLHVGIKQFVGSVTNKIPPDMERLPDLEITWTSVASDSTKTKGILIVPGDEILATATSGRQ